MISEVDGGDDECQVDNDGEVDDTDEVGDGVGDDIYDSEVDDDADDDDDML